MQNFCNICATKELAKALVFFIQWMLTLVWHGKTTVCNACNLLHF